MSNVNELATIIKNRRAFLKYTQADMAELTGLTDRTIRSIENGEHSTALQSWLKVLDILGLEMKLQVKSLGDETGKSVL
ncbi:helix-turn-helix transcriptional regulator [Flavisolibacter sp. BT320]|nr:helix-turn-helix transcriptional regulator [Flavisolibacter longurius]